METGEPIRFAGYWMIPYIKEDGEVFFCPSAQHRLSKKNLWPDKWPMTQAEALAGKIMYANYLQAMYLSRNFSCTGLINFFWLAAHVYKTNQKK